MKRVVYSIDNYILGFDLLGLGLFDRLGLGLFDRLGLGLFDRLGLGLFDLLGVISGPTYLPFT